MTTIPKINKIPFSFELPANLECSKPTEVRGLRRDEVRLMVSEMETDKIHHDVFKNIVEYLNEGDVLVVNTSGTMKAALTGVYNNETNVNVHFSTQTQNKKWVIEIREIIDGKTRRFSHGKIGGFIQLKNGGKIKLVKPYYNESDHNSPIKDDNQNHLQLWIVDLLLNNSLENYLEQHGENIRYNYLKDSYPTSYYQTVFANEMGSAEMPSAGRAFTSELISKLIIKGVEIVPVLLHTGVASLEKNEKPYEEYFRVSEHSANRINFAKKQGKKIIAVGTTVVRTLETLANKHKEIHAGTGWTNIFITPEKGLKIVDGLLTGFHEPQASHLFMLEALARREHLEKTYNEAIEENYLWHEFGDLHLLMP